MVDSGEPLELTKLSEYGPNSAGDRVVGGRVGGRVGPSVVVGVGGGVGAEVGYVVVVHRGLPFRRKRLGQ